MDTLPENPPTGPGRWTLVRDAGVLQFKLIVDGLRDLLLVPLSLIAALISLLRSDNGRPGPQFYRLLAAGKRSERWIGLFSALRNAPPSVVQEAADEPSIDDLILRAENYVVDEYRRGGVTAQAKERLQSAFDALLRRRR